MRLAYIHQYYANRDMPGGTRSFEMARRLVRSGHEVHLITTDRQARRGSVRWRTTDEDGIHVHWLPVPYSNEMTYRRRVVAFAHFALCATVRALSIRPDLVLGSSTPLTVVLPGVTAARLHRVPFVFEVRDLWPEVPIELGALRDPAARRAAMALAGWAYRNSAKVVALSPGMKDGVVARGYPADDVTVIPNACDVDLFEVSDERVERFRQSRGWLQHRPLVVYAGALGRANGVGYLVRVAAEMAQLAPEVRFLVAGEGYERSALTAEAERLGVLGHNLFLEPWMPKSEIPVLLGAATVATSLFLPVPGLAHNSANKFFDALAAGRPVAVNYGGWQADLLTDRGAGLVLDPADHHAAAEVLARHLTDADWVKSASEAALKLAEGEFARDLQFERLEGVLSAAVASWPGSHGARRRGRRQ